MSATTWLIIGILACVVVLIITVRIRTAPKEGDCPSELEVAADSFTPDAKPQQTAAVQPVIETGIPARTVAAIMAAIEASSNGAALRFVAIRRAETSKNTWSSSGTADIITNRQQYL